MSSTLAILTSDPNLLVCQLGMLERHVRLFGEKTPAAVGLGYVEANNVLLRKKPGNVGSLAMEHLAADVASESLFFHSGGSALQFLEEDVFPLRYKRWMWVHHSDAKAGPELKGLLARPLPDFLKRQARGSTAGELAFMRFLAQLKAQNRIEDFDIGEGSVGQLLALAAREVEAAERETGEKVTGLGYFVTNGRVMAAARLGSAPLYYALLEGIARCDRCGITETTADSNPLLRAHRRVRGVALCTDIKQSGGFLEVPERSVIMVGRNLEVSVAPVDR